MMWNHKIYGGAIMSESAIKDMFNKTEHEEEIELLERIEKELKELKEIKQLMVPKTVYVPYPVYITKEPCWYCEPYTVEFNPCDWCSPQWTYTDINTEYPITASYACT